jgi:hypothetical protein
VSGGCPGERAALLVSDPEHGSPKYSVGQRIRNSQSSSFQNLVERPETVCGGTTADYKSAIRQIENLRYVPTLLRKYQGALSFSFEFTALGGLYRTAFKQST